MFYHITHQHIVDVPRFFRRERFGLQFIVHPLHSSYLTHSDLFVCLYVKDGGLVMAYGCFMKIFINCNFLKRSKQGEWIGRACRTH